LSISSVRRERGEREEGRGAAAGPLRPLRSLRLCVRHFANLAREFGAQRGGEEKRKGGQNAKAHGIASRIVRFSADSTCLPIGKMGAFALGRALRSSLLCGRAVRAPTGRYRYFAPTRRRIDETTNPAWKAGGEEVREEGEREEVRGAAAESLRPLRLCVRHFAYLADLARVFGGGTNTARSTPPPLRAPPSRRGGGTRGAIRGTPKGVGRTMISACRGHGFCGLCLAPAGRRAAKRKNPPRGLVRGPGKA
jgi:hypothetical protein